VTRLESARPRQRRLALIALLAAGVLAVVAFPFRATWWGGWILAIAEAGIVGGLADWFAVTALFRRPLGLPIPHTALIPANWELMAARVGTMVGDRVLTREYVASEIARIDVADLLARAAERISRRELEVITGAVARWVTSEVPPTLGGDLAAALRRLAVTTPVAPLLASGIEVARQHGWDQRLIGAVARAAADALERPDVRKTVGDLLDELLTRYRERMKPYPRLFLGLADLFGLIDRDRIVTAIHAAVVEIAGDPAHPVRQRIADTLTELPERLRLDARLAARVEATKTELLEADAVERLVHDAAAELERTIRADLADPRSEIVAWVTERLDRARRALVTDAALRDDIARWVKDNVTSWVDRFHGRIAGFIENGVLALGPEGVVRLIEEHAGDDLQYIRVNGTVVGGLAGGALYAVHLLLRLT
jgi:uncharacterized membrane-anchored protein YjiN (DUF445 family)